MLPTGMNIAIDTASTTTTSEARAILTAGFDSLISSKKKEPIVWLFKKTIVKTASQDVGLGGTDAVMSMNAELERQVHDTEHYKRTSDLPISRQCHMAGVMGQKCNMMHRGCS